MNLAHRLGVPLIGAAIALTYFVGVPNAAAAQSFCTYKVTGAPNGLFIHNAPNDSASSRIKKVPNGTTGPASAATTSGFRTFQGGWASAAYLTKQPLAMCGG